MNVSISEARIRLAQLIRAMEDGECVVITRKGKPIAQLARPPLKRRKVVFGGMKDRITLKPGWDDPISLDEFLKGEF